ncbi:hypothetical protein CK203_053138 [Vitis vinifera]|uniref:Uncharacterized protein n=1 Tax=Vitis vinifera TaxID=29760 RepID=A0A438GP23_VITVI|nr:hypothetical protein CK203_053138 [Vitis vinifera]
MPTEKGEKTLSSSQGTIQRGAPVPSAGLVQGIPPLLSDSTIFIHPNLVRVLMGCSISTCCTASTLRYWNCSLTARFDKGRGEGAGGSLGWMGGAIAASVEAFSPNYTLKIPGATLWIGWKRRPLPASAKLFEIDPKERSSGSPRNMKLKRLTLKGGESSWRIEIRKRLKALSGRLPDRSGVRISPPKKLQEKGEAGEEAWEGCEEPTPPKEFPPPQTTYEGEVMIEEPLKRPVGGSGGRKPKSAFRRPGSLGHSPGERPPSKKPRLTRDLQSGLFGRLQERSKRLKLAALLPMTLIRMEASPFSYAELEVKLKQITPDWKAIKPSAKMFDMIETLVRGLRAVQQHDLFTQLLQTADYMRTFSSRRQEIENQLRLRMEEAEAIYPPCERKMKALRVELAEAKGREESTAGRLHEAEGEAARLRDE